MFGERVEDGSPSGKWGDRESIPPHWSGVFTNLGEGVAQMMVHDSDERQHHAPPGWELFSIERVGSTEIFVYVTQPLRAVE